MRGLRWQETRTPRRRGRRAVLAPAILHVALVEEDSRRLLWSCCAPDGVGRLGLDLYSPYNRDETVRAYRDRPMQDTLADFRIGQRVQLDLTRDPRTMGGRYATVVLLGGALVYVDVDKVGLRGYLPRELVNAEI